MEIKEENLKNVIDILAAHSLVSEGYIPVNDDFKLLITDARRLKKIISDAKEELEEVEDRIKSLLKDNLGVCNRKGEVLIDYKTIKRKSFDSSAFKTVHPELYNEFTKETEYKRLTVK